MTQTSVKGGSSHGRGKPHLYRDMINALSGKPRFAIREAEALADQVRSLVDRSADPAAGIWEMMLDRSLARAYLRYGNSRKAADLLTRQFESGAALRQGGALHIVSVQSTYAELAWRQGDMESWHGHVQSAVRRAVAAGLLHQIGTMHELYGSKLIQIMHVEGIAAPGIDGSYMFTD